MNKTIGNKLLDLFPIFLAKYREMMGSSRLLDCMKRPSHAAPDNSAKAVTEIEYFCLNTRLDPFQVLKHVKKLN